MGLRVAGVDMLRSNHGPVVMEVNSSPGLEGIEKTTGKDVAGYGSRIYREERRSRQNPNQRQGMMQPAITVARQQDQTGGTDNGTGPGCPFIHP